MNFQQMIEMDYQFAVDAIAWKYLIDRMEEHEARRQAVLTKLNTIREESIAGLSTARSSSLSMMHLCMGYREQMWDEVNDYLRSIKSDFAHTEEVHVSKL